MLINFIGPRVDLNPERYPEGLVILVYAKGGGHGSYGVEHLSRKLDPEAESKWTTPSGTACSHQTYSLTGHEDVTGLDEEGFGDFLVTSMFTELGGEEDSRAISVNLIHRPEGWMVELTDYRVEDSDTFSYPLGQRFNPMAVLDLEGPKPKEIPEEKPPGGTIWERLEDEG